MLLTVETMTLECGWLNRNSRAVSPIFQLFIQIPSFMLFISFHSLVRIKFLLTYPMRILWTTTIDFM